MVLFSPLMLHIGTSGDYGGGLVVHVGEVGDDKEIGTTEKRQDGVRFRVQFGCLLEPNGSNTVSRYLQSGPFPAFSGHLLWSPVNSHQLLETPVGVSFISLFVISWTRIM